MELLKKCFLCCFTLPLPPILLYLLQMAEMIKDSQRSSLDLRKELDECKEKSRSQLTALQQQLKTKGLEVEKSLLMTKKLQDEVMQDNTVYLTFDY